MLLFCFSPFLLSLLLSSLLSTFFFCHLSFSPSSSSYPQCQPCHTSVFRCTICPTSRQQRSGGAAVAVGLDRKLCVALSNHQRGVTVQFPATSPYNERTITVNPSGGAIESGKVSNNCSFVPSVSLSRVHSNMATCNYCRSALPTPRRSASIASRRGCSSASVGSWEEREKDWQGAERITSVRVNGRKCSGTCW